MSSKEIVLLSKFFKNIYSISRKQSKKIIEVLQKKLMEQVRPVSKDFTPNITLPVVNMRKIRLGSICPFCGKKLEAGHRTTIIYL